MKCLILHELCMNKKSQLVINQTHHTHDTRSPTQTLDMDSTNPHGEAFEKRVTELLKGEEEKARDKIGLKPASGLQLPRILVDKATGESLGTSAIIEEEEEEEAEATAEERPVYLQGISDPPSQSTGSLIGVSHLHSSEALPLGETPDENSRLVTQYHAPRSLPPKKRCLCAPKLSRKLKRGCLSAWKGLNLLLWVVMILPVMLVYRLVVVEVATFLFYVISTRELQQAVAVFTFTTFSITQVLFSWFLRNTEDVASLGWLCASYVALYSHVLGAFFMRWIIFKEYWTPMEVKWKWMKHKHPIQDGPLNFMFIYVDQVVVSTLLALLFSTDLIAGIQTRALLLTTETAPSGTSIQFVNIRTQTWEKWCYPTPGDYTSLVWVVVATFASGILAHSISLQDLTPDVQAPVVKVELSLHKARRGNRLPDNSLP